MNLINKQNNKDLLINKRNRKELMNSTKGNLNKIKCLMIFINKEWKKIIKRLKMI